MFFNKKSAEEKMIDSVVENIGYDRETVKQAIANIRANNDRMTSANLMVECGLISSKNTQRENDRKWFGVGD